MTQRLPRLQDEVDVLPDMIYATGNKKYYICHGQQFDKREGKFTILSKITFSGATFLYWLNRVYNTTRKKLGRKYRSLISSLKRIAKLWMIG